MGNEIDKKRLEIVNRSIAEAAKAYRQFYDSSGYKQMIEEITRANKFFHSYMASSLVAGLPNYIKQITTLADSQRKQIESLNLGRAVEILNGKQAVAFYQPSSPSPMQNNFNLLRENAASRSTVTKDDLDELRANITADIFGKLDAEKQKEFQSNQTILYLSKTGDLFSKPRDKFCYPLNKVGSRLKLVTILTDEFQKTESIMEQSDFNTISSLRSAIKEINRIAKTRLGIEGSLIEGRSGSGYRINSNFKIVAE